MNSFGTRFRLTLWGESHGPSIGVVLDGVEPGLPLREADFAADLARRAAGAPGTTTRRESDEPQLLSGVYRGMTTGAPLAIAFANGDVRSDDYRALRTQARPSHADRVGAERWRGCNDPRGGGHFSGRLTLGIVAAGVVAKKMLPGVSVHASLVEAGGERDPLRFEQAVLAAAREGDSVGGVVECRACGLPTGWGEPFFDSVESAVSHLLFAIPAVKGVEFGAGFEGARMRGSRYNDAILDAAGRTATNHDGGVNGGLTNGNELLVRAAIKPTPSIACEQRTFDARSGAVEPLRIAGRHDACIALRAAVVVEAAVAVALADLRLRR